MKTRTIAALVTAIVVMITTVMLSVHSTRAQGIESPLSYYLPVVTNNYDSSWRALPAQSLTLSPSPTINAPLLGIDPAGRAHIFWDTNTSLRYLYHAYLMQDGWRRQPGGAGRNRPDGVAFPGLPASGIGFAGWRQ